jgi:hypothetical protein
MFVRVLSAMTRPSGSGNVGAITGISIERSYHQCRSLVAVLTLGPIILSRAENLHEEGGAIADQALELAAMLPHAGRGRQSHEHLFLIVVALMVARRAAALPGGPES